MMNILAIGEKKRREELRQKLNDFEINEMADLPEDAEINSYDLIFDLNFDDQTGRIERYKHYKNILIASSVKIPLAAQKPESFTLAGINTLPTFINREKAELTLYDQVDEPKVKAIFQELNWNCTIVNDRVGMVTPRVIFMIINEACYTLQEGTAGIEDIDLGMKLGTNYPYGPFEWADKIGIKEIYETLKAVYEDTGEERYKICPLLKTYFLKDKKFYPSE